MEAFESFVALALESEGLVVSEALKFPVTQQTTSGLQTHGYLVDLLGGSRKSPCPRDGEVLFRIARRRRRACRRRGDQGGVQQAQRVTEQSVRPGYRRGRRRDAIRLLRRRGRVEALCREVRRQNWKPRSARAAMVRAP